MARTRRLRGSASHVELFTEENPCVSNDFADIFLIDKNCTETPTAMPSSPPPTDGIAAASDGSESAPSLVYRCGSYRYCSEESPDPSYLESDAPSPWDLAGTCGEGQQPCPQEYEEGGTYAMDDTVAVSTPALVYECDDEARCNSSSPSAWSGGGAAGAAALGSGWGLVGGCGSGDDCPDAHDPEGVYEAGDRVAVGSVDTSDSSTVTAEGGDSTDLVYTYECSRPRLCNEAAPYESDRAWDLTGSCVPSSAGYGVGCPEEYSWYDWYGRGDSVSVSVDGLNSDLVDSLTCPDGDSGAGEGVVTYAYEVESRLVSDPKVFLPRLEESILLNLAGYMLGCLEEIDARRLETAFEPRGIDSKPDDVAVLEAPCTISTPGADSCFVISGALTLNLVDGDDTSADLSRVLLRRAMDQDELLSPKTPEVVKVRYLADSIGDADQQLAAGGMAGGATAKGGTSLFSPTVLGAIAGAVGLLVVALLAMLFAKRSSKKRKREVEEGDAADDLDSGAAFAAPERDEVTLHVSNIAPETPDGFLREVFEQHGEVRAYASRTDDDNTLDLKRLAREEDASLNEPFAPESSRHALVTMDEEGARSAAEYADGLECDGYVLRVREADDVDRMAFRLQGVEANGGIKSRQAMAVTSLMDGDSLASGSYFNDPRRFGLSGTMSAIEEGEDEDTGGDGDSEVVRESGRPSTPSGRKTPSGRRTPGMLVMRSLGRTKRGRGKRGRNELAEIGVDVSRHGEESLDPEADLDRYVSATSPAATGAAGCRPRPDGANHFHLGNHHYDDGGKYYSTGCAQCRIAMSRLGPAGLVPSETEDDDESTLAGVARAAGAAGRDDDDARSYVAGQCVEFTDYDYSQLGQHHSTTHVPCCKSGTCVLCRSPGSGVVFVKTEG